LKIPTHFTTITSEKDFTRVALETFRFQYEAVAEYRKFCDLLGTDISKVQHIKDIPFLPIQFFKTEKILASGKKPEKVFTSSGTTGTRTSSHYISDIALYETSFLTTFTQFYGEISQYVILALLPSYLERGGSSLVYMVDVLIKESKQPDSGFYLNDTDALIQKLKELEARKQKILLLGVSYALLDVLEKENFQLKNTIIMETGGMKGRRKEMVKQALHAKLSEGFGVPHIHSEYGMTELLSQAYATSNGLFTCPPWMKVLTRNTEDALSYVEKQTGGLNIIDLANTYSCAFIATQDLGKVYPDNTFEVMGRFDNSDIRGCNLMVL
jgi:phenylacetate-coenzyme A ligase PaaK-like adenylate-forming protein